MTSPLDQKLAGILRDGVVAEQALVMIEAIVDSMIASDVNEVCELIDKHELTPDVAVGLCHRIRAHKQITQRLNQKVKSAAATRKRLISQEDGAGDES